MTFFPDIKEMRAKVSAEHARQEKEVREEKCRVMSETISFMRDTISTAINKAAEKGHYTTGLAYKDHFSQIELPTVLFCLKKVAEELHAEGYQVKVSTDCKITVSWKWEEE